MTALLNRRLFSTTGFDSAALGVLASIVHQFTEPGRYAVSIMQGGQHVGSTVFEVDEGSSVMQLTLDLASIHSAVRSAVMAACECEGGIARAIVPSVSPKGYVLFHASQGEGYSALVGLDQPNVQPLFDSRQLAKGDLYAISLIKPATYAMANAAGKSKGTITVTFSHDGKKPFKAPDTQHIDVSAALFEPSEVEVTATQGIVFHVQDVARITIEAKTDESARVTTKHAPLRFTFLKPQAR